MTRFSDPYTPHSRRGTRFFLSAALVVLSVFSAFVIAEIILRIVPIPGVGLHAYCYDDVTGGRHYPNAVYTYRNDRGDYVKRKVNSWGYLDTEHERMKAPNTVRIGFFGDSYTQAVQVPLEETFFRRIEATLNERHAAAGRKERRYEAIAFGISGYGTLQSYLESRRWMGTADLDYVVYVFVENDLGDQIPAIKRSDAIPYPVLSGDTIVIDDSFKRRYAYKKSWLHRLQQYLKAHSLALDTAISRAKLLRGHGVKTTVTPEERQMAVRGDKTTIPESGWAPSTWPDTLRAKAATLGERVLTRWAEEVRQSGRTFIVLYIPREREMYKPFAEQDTWAEWLAAVCAEENIPLVDPSPQLVKRRDRGEEVFFDHLAASGHAAVSDAFVEFFDSVEP
jgi:hypothetical protein